MKPFPLSVATRSALTLSAAIAVVFAIAGFFSYQDARTQSLSDALAKLDSYNHEIAGEQEDRFQRLAAAHRHAIELLSGELRTAPGGRSEFDRLYPRQADGTRRSAPGLFDGLQTPFGYVRGMGAFIGGEPDAAERRRLLAATRVVHAVGEGLRPDLKSLYFFTPRNDLIMFAPDRADRLIFYRKLAPPSFDFRRAEMFRITTPANNPTRRTKCTSLQTVVSDPSNTIWTTGCQTPVDIGGVHVGAFGTSVLLDDLLTSSHFEGLSTAAVILISREGRLIRHPAYTVQNSAATARHLDLTRTTDPGLKALWAFVRQHAREDHFIGAAPDLNAFVAMRKVETPGWYALTIQPEHVVLDAARQALARAIVSALICIAVVALLLFLILRRQVAAPLRRLIADTRTLAARVRPAGAARPQPRPGGDDEVSQLAANFAAMADQILAAHSTLERQVAQRTIELARANDELRNLAERDWLTGLLNRRKVIELLEQAIANDAGLSVILFDIDHFKTINDTHGHVVGDQVLQRLGEALPPLFRPSDALARIGGEEFLGVLPGADAANAWHVAERVRRALGSLLLAGAQGHIEITVSVGVAQRLPGETVESLYHRADKALYQAKRLGRNRTRLSPEHQPPADMRAAG